MADLSIDLRHQIAHELLSPVRGASIVADLLAESLEADETDPEFLAELSELLSTLVDDLNRRLREFAGAQDA